MVPWRLLTEDMSPRGATSLAHVYMEKRGHSLIQALGSHMRCRRAGHEASIGCLQICMLLHFPCM